jgi:plastocyanin
MMKTVLVCAVLLALVACASADVYMHAPRGNNNRCDEQNNDRNNNNRLFNSQNNAAGGYAVAPPMYYYAGSVLSLEWYNQHSCGPNGKVRCNIVWQYACDDTFKDGTSEDPTGDNGGNTCTDEVTAGNENNNDVGRHESLNYFTACNTRDRNAGLFNAAEAVSNANGAQATRQNAGGGTSGFECQEERDYYPYWHPTPFRDIAVLTTNATERCDYYRAQSENVLGKHLCTSPQFNNQAACLTGGGTWDQQDDHGLRAPDCDDALWSRDNTLGGGIDGYLNSYNWTVPLDVNDVCFVRIRYNISTADYDDWNTYSGSNGANSPVQDDPVILFSDMPIKLAIDTNQFGRTFEDRSYVFEIRTPVLQGLATNIYNINVRGKRGNIAQVRNCVEYDFTPQRLHAAIGDYIHFQWTGSNHNPAGNAGEGRNRWDRSNVMQMINNDLAASYPEPHETQSMFRNADTAYLAAFIGQTNCADYTAVETGAVNDQDTTNCAKLNGNPTGYFDLGLLRLNRTGTYNYMSSRNNNFSNRGQKASLLIRPFGRGFWVGVFVVLGLAGVGAAVSGVYYVSRNNGAGWASFRNSAAFGRRASAHSGGSHNGSGQSHGSHRSKGSKSSFGGSMI